MGATGIAWLNNAAGADLIAGSYETGLGPENLVADRMSPANAWQTQSGITFSTLIIRPPAGGSTWRTIGFFRSNLTAAAHISIYFFNGVTPVGTTTVAAPARGYGQALVVMPDDVVADEVHISISDVTNPDGFLNIAGIFAGPMWFPTFAATPRSSFGRTDRTDNQVSLGGQEYPTPRWQQRYWQVDFANLSDAEMWATAMEIDRIARLGGNVLVVPQADSTFLNQQAVFGILRTSSAGMGFPTSSPRLISWNFVVTERL